MFGYRVMWRSGRLGEPGFVAYEDLSHHQRERLAGVHVAVLYAVAEHFGVPEVEVQEPLAVGRPPEEIAHQYLDGAIVGVDVAARLVRHCATGGSTQWGFGIAGRARLSFGDDPIGYVASETELGALLGEVVGEGAVVHEWPDPSLRYQRLADEEYVLTAADRDFWERVRHACRVFPGPHLLQEVWAPPAGLVYHALTEPNAGDVAALLKPGALIHTWFTVPRFDAREMATLLEGMTSEEIDGLDVHLRLLPTATSRLEHALFDGEDLLAEVTRADADPDARYCRAPDCDAAGSWLHAHLAAVTPWPDTTVKPRWVQDREWLEAELRPPKASR